jgi:hypothetical protein
MMTIDLAHGIHLPLDAVTQTFLVVGKRGSGKSNTAARLVEQMHRANLPFVVLDPTDTWWGVKAGTDGKPGLKVYVFGGRHADLPLESTGGALLAQVLCEHRLPMVLSVKHLSGRERSTFMTAFAQTLFQKWAGGPLHVVLEEAHELAPQSVQNGRDGEQAMLGAFKRLWKLGRASGIGGTAVTQRPAALSKDITTQSEILIAHRIIGPQDVAAVGEWVKYHGEHTKILGELPSLPTGEAFLWAPEFPEGRPLGLSRIKVHRRDTFDSASTPKVGEQRVEPRQLAPVDMAILRTKMAATIAEAEASDPKALRARIAALEREVAERPPAPMPTVVERPIITDGQITALNAIADRLRSIGEQIASEGEAIAEGYNVIRSATALWLEPHRAQWVETKKRDDVDRLAAERLLRPPTLSANNAAHGDTSLKTMARAVLTALAQHGALSKGKVLAYTGYRSSGPVSTMFAELTRRGFIAPVNSRISITSAGLEALGPYEKLPTGAALRARVMTDGKLSTMQSRMLGVLFDAYPKAIAKGDILKRLGYASSGPVSTAFAHLVSIDYAVPAGRGALVAADVFFDVR